MSEKLYALLLKLYPDHFRRAYSDEALRLVRDRAQDEKGFISGLRLWLDLLADLALSLPREYRRAPRAPMAAQPLNGEPSFQLLVGGSLHPTLLCLAGALSAMLLWMCVSVVGHTKIFPPSFVDSNSLQEIVESALAQVSAAPTSTRSVSGSKKRPAFDVISIKRHAAEGGPVQLGPTPGGFRSIGLPMFGIFQWAYALPNQSGLLRGDLILGAPGWLSGDPYDVVATVGQADRADWQKPEVRQKMLRSMLQAMLADRCKAVVHYAGKEVPVYDLVLAKRGPRFKQAETVDEATLRQKHPAGGMMRGSGTMAVEGPNRMQFYAIPMSILANTILPSAADRPVVDKTGLTGYYDLALPSSALRPRPPAPLPAAGQAPDAPSPSPEDESIFGAVEALGLRLEPAKGQVQTLVIDHVERPSEN